MSDTVLVEVAYATPITQLVVKLEVPSGTTVIDAVGLSGIHRHFDGLKIDSSTKLGIWGKHVEHHHMLEGGERVEIYRPLLVDPKTIRKDRAARNRAQRLGQCQKGSGGS